MPSWDSPAVERLLPWLPVLVTLAVYAPACIGSGWVLDDRWLFADGLDGLGDIASHWLPGAQDTYTWRPLAWTLQVTVGYIFGNAAPTYRALNLVGHLLNVALLQACGRDVSGSRRVGALLATAWTLHPATPDTLCWSADGFDIGATTFSLLALRVALRAETVPRTLWLAPCVLAALLCKETAMPIVGVGAIVLAARGHWRLAATAGGLGAGTAITWAGWHALVTGQVNQPSVDAASALSAWISAWPWMVVVPVQAGVTHVFEASQLLRPVAGAAFGLFLLVVTLRVRERATRLAALAWVMMLAPLGPGVPLIGLQPLRYTYLPLAVALACLAGSTLLRASPRALVLTLFGWGILQAPRTLGRVEAWHDEASVWGDELAIEPDNRMTLLFAGRDLVLHGEGAAKHEGLQRWARALDLPATTRLQAFARLGSRLDLAQAAFLSGEPAFARVQIDRFIAEEQAARRTVPAIAWCLAADSRDRIGMPVPKEMEDGCGARPAVGAEPAESAPTPSR